MTTIHLNFYEVGELTSPRNVRSSERRPLSGRYESVAPTIGGAQDRGKRSVSHGDAMFTVGSNFYAHIVSFRDMMTRVWEGDDEIELESIVSVSEEDLTADGCVEKNPGPALRRSTKPCNEREKQAALMRTFQARLEYRRIRMEMDPPTPSESDEGERSDSSSSSCEEEEDLSQLHPAMRAAIEARRAGYAIAEVVRFDLPQVAPDRLFCCSTHDPNSDDDHLVCIETNPGETRGSKGKRKIRPQKTAPKGFFDDFLQYLDPSDSSEDIERSGVKLLQKPSLVSLESESNFDSWKLVRARQKAKKRALKEAIDSANNGSSFVDQFVGWIGRSWSAPAETVYEMVDLGPAEKSISVTEEETVLKSTSMAALGITAKKPVLQEDVVLEESVYSQISIDDASEDYESADEAGSGVVIEDCDSTVAIDPKTGHPFKPTIAQELISKKIEVQEMEQIRADIAREPVIDSIVPVVGENCCAKDKQCFHHFSKNGCKLGVKCKKSHLPLASYCNDFQTGKCARENCKFFHAIEQKGVCRGYTAGNCMFGAKCRYAHPGESPEGSSSSTSVSGSVGTPAASPVSAQASSLPTPTGDNTRKCSPIEENIKNMRLEDELKGILASKVHVLETYPTLKDLPVITFDQVEDYRTMVFENMSHGVRGFRLNGKPNPFPVTACPPFRTIDNIRTTPLEWVVCDMPREFWPKYIRPSRRKGLVSKVSHFFGCGDDYENVNTVELVYLPFASVRSPDFRPNRDRLDPYKDDFVVVSQPYIKTTLVDRAYVHYTALDLEKPLRSMDYVHQSGSLPREPGFHPIDNFSKMVQELESNFVPILSAEAANDAHYYKRLPISRTAFRFKRCPEITTELNNIKRSKHARHNRFVFDVQYTSLFMMSELLSRRIFFTPKLDVATQVERLIRTYSEETLSNSFAGYTLRGVYVARQTLSLLVGMHLGDMVTPIRDF